MTMPGKDEVGGMCSYWWDANLGIRSTPLATSSDSQMVKIFAFYPRAATVATKYCHSSSFRRCKNQQSPASRSPKHPNRSSRVILVRRPVLSFNHFLFMFLGSHFLGFLRHTVGVPAMKAQRVPWVFSPPLTGHQINYPIYQRERKGPPASQ